MGDRNWGIGQESVLSFIKKRINFIKRIVNIIHFIRNFAVKTMLFCKSVTNDILALESFRWTADAGTILAKNAAFMQRLACPGINLTMQRCQAGMHPVKAGYRASCLLLMVMGKLCRARPSKLRHVSLTGWHSLRAVFANVDRGLG